MTGIGFTLLAAFFGTTSNFCMRGSIGVGGSARTFLVCQLSLSTFTMLIINFVYENSSIRDPFSFSMGILGGLVLGFMMWCLGRALENGPPGLTFAILNSACVMPAIVMATIFGSEEGFPYTFWNAIGSVLVVAGLLWAGWSKSSRKNSKWSILALLAFLAHVCLMTILQMRAHLLQSLPKLQLPLEMEINSSWFMPILFATATLTHLIPYVISQKHLTSVKELFWGMSGGIFNGINMFLLTLATHTAVGWEKALIFPVSSVTTIILCNGWAQWLYREKVNWKANSLCASGVLLAGLNGFI